MISHTVTETPNNPDSDCLSWDQLAEGLETTKPSMFIEHLREAGVLKRALPEIARLWGIPQKAKHHPEVCTGIHCMLALDYAAERGWSLPVRYAVLVHDLGKGITPSELLPSHIGHDIHGVPLVSEVSTRLGVPEHIKKMAEIMCLRHIEVHSVFQCSHKSATRLLYNLQAFEGSNTFFEILEACEADARGRLGLKDRIYTQTQYLRELFAVAQSVDAAKIRATCRYPDNFPMQLKQAQVMAIREAMPELVKRLHPAALSQ